MRTRDHYDHEQAKSTAQLVWDDEPARRQLAMVGRRTMRPVRDGNQKEKEKKRTDQSDDTRDDVTGVSTCTRQWRVTHSLLLVSFHFRKGANCCS